MYRNALIIASILMLCLTAACSGLTANASANTTSSTVLSQITDSSRMTVKDKLGIGILSLDGTSLAVTSDQAVVLLPLWQAVKSLGADKNAASVEIAALYTQIQDTLTADQVARIEQFTWSQTELVSLVEQYQSQTSQATTTAKSTTSTSTSSQGQNMGGGPGGDMLPPDGGIMMGAGSGLTAGQNTTTTTQQSLILSQTSSQSSVELNVLFANAVINLLQQQADL
jgi:hypothetical protein